MSYKPKRSPLKWLKAAPAYVLSVHDAPRYDDRYSVLLTEPFWQPGMASKVPCLALSVDPNHPQGVSQFCEVESRNRDACGRKIRWLDLPEKVRAHIKARCRVTDNEASVSAVS